MVAWCVETVPGRHVANCSHLAFRLLSLHSSRAWVRALADHMAACARAVRMPPTNRLVVALTRSSWAGTKDTRDGAQGAVSPRMAKIEPSTRISSPRRRVWLQTCQRSRLRRGAPCAAPILMRFHPTGVARARRKSLKKCKIARDVVGIYPAICATIARMWCYMVV